MTGSAQSAGPICMATHHTSAGHSTGVTTRSERVAQRSAGQSLFAHLADHLKRDHRGKFIVLMFLTSIALSCVMGAWNPPLRYRVNGVADRAIICHTPFSVFSPEQTRLAIDRARSTAPRVFVNDPQPLVQLREALLWNTIAGLTRVHAYDELEEQEKVAWLELLQASGPEETLHDSDIQASFADFIAYFNDETNFTHFQTQLQHVFAPFEEHGILIRLPFGTEHGSQDRILVYRRPLETSDQAVEFLVSHVLLRDGTALRDTIRREVENHRLGNFQLHELLFHWIYPKIPETLTVDPFATANVEAAAEEKVEPVRIEYAQGQLLINAGTVLQPGDVKLLLAEHHASLLHRTWTARCSRFVAVAAVFFVIFVALISLVLRQERRRPHTPKAFFSLMLGMIGTVALAEHIQPAVAIFANWEILPLTLFVMVVAVVYSWELATVLAMFLAVVVVGGNGGSVGLFIILLGTSVATAVQLGRLRSREKLFIVGTVAGLAAFFLTIALGIQADRSLGDGQLFRDAVINFFWALLAGLLMTGILPFVERQLGILTDMSLRELGDVSHPLIQKLLKAAPATYEHCMQVGSIAEAAAEAVHARSLLTRVGAHFHDIGKLMKPEYFSENQGGMRNVHDTIEPQLSTIVLIAHIKDGVDMARQYHLPKPLIDLIEQHHGTSLISFFYSRATKGGKEDVEESTFRYPGPKPQMKEAAVLMIADSCESACRSMGAGVPPNKIEAKVRALIKQKLDDGQFDESGLTLGEIKIIEKSVTNSIVAAMHGRIQYPESPEKREHSSGIYQSEEAVRWSTG